MAEFMQGAVARTKKRKNDASEPATAPTGDREADLARRAAQLHDVPRSEWPADVLEYQRQRQRQEKRAERAALEQEDQLRRGVEQTRRREQLGEQEPDEDPQQREASRRKSRTKRVRNNDDYGANSLPGDLMSDEELAAARGAPAVPLDDDTKGRIVERVRIALSDARQGERVCAVCDEIVLKCESSIGRVCEQLCATLQRRCSGARAQPSLPPTLIEQYDCVGVHARLSGVLLSPTAFAVARAELAADADVSTLATTTSTTRSRWAMLPHRGDTVLDWVMGRQLFLARHLQTTARRRRSCQRPCAQCSSRRRGRLRITPQ
jgi:hypothetical protein